MYKVVSREFTSTRFEIYQSLDLKRLQAMCYKCGNWVAVMYRVGDGDTLSAVGCCCRTNSIGLEEAISASGLSLLPDPKLRNKILYYLTDGTCQISTEGITDGGVSIHVFQWIAFWAGINVLSIDIDELS